MTPGISRRLALIEKAARPPERPPTWVEVIVEPGETEEVVQARYVAEHPEMPTPRHWIVIRIVDPPERQGST